MQKLISIVFVAGLMLLLLAAAIGHLSIKYLSAIAPADSYENKGIHPLFVGEKGSVDCGNDPRPDR